ncbi:hypothetical protein BK60_14505 [Neisseria gonorrhoeae]|nr:hypothetical protein BK60_14505 [Neisseria gonorrhoeae]
MKNKKLVIMFLNYKLKKKMICIVIMILILVFITDKKLIMVDYSLTVNDDKHSMKVVVDIILLAILEMQQYELLIIFLV